MIPLIAGTYKGRGGGGLTPLTYDPAAERLTMGTPLPELANASAGVPLPDGRFAFVDEMASRIVVTDTQRWLPITSLASGGDGPCHLAVDLQGRHLAAANYGDGAIALFALKDGVPVEPPAVHRSTGHGGDPKRQAGPHAHWVGFAPGSGRLYAVDLGTDQLLMFDAARDGRLDGARQAYAAPPGSGPRHLAFHPSLPVAYLVSELASTLTVLGIEPDGRLIARRILSTLPPGAPSDSLAGAIVLSRAGDRLFVSNRGHDSVAAFRVARDGDVALADIAPSGGSSPRFLLLLEPEQRLLVAHERADGVTTLAVDPHGRLTPTRAHADVPGAVFLARVG